MNKFILAIAAGLLFSGTPAMAEPVQDSQPVVVQSPNNVVEIKPDDPYWIHKGFNDTMFQVNSGEFNEAHSEQYEAQTKAIVDRIIQPQAPIEVIYRGRNVGNDDFPALKVYR